MRLWPRRSLFLRLFGGFIGVMLGVWLGVLGLDMYETRHGNRFYAEAQAQGYVQLDLERMAAHPPDAVLWAAPSSRALANRFAEHPVLKRVIPPSRWLTTDYWRWQCPGPWTWDLIRQLQQWRG